MGVLGKRLLFNNIFFYYICKGKIYMLFIYYYDKICIININDIQIKNNIFSILYEIIYIL